MRADNPLLRNFGFLFLFIGAGLTLKMYFCQDFPISLFIFLCVIGILQIILSVALRPMRIIWQIFWTLIPFILILIWITSRTNKSDLILAKSMYRFGLLVIKHNIGKNAFLFAGVLKGRWEDSSYASPSRQHAKKSIDQQQWLTDGFEWIQSHRAWKLPWWIRRKV